MQIKPVLDSGHLWAVSQVFPPELLDLIQAQPWHQLEYRRLVIGSGLRREIQFNPDSIIDHVFTVLVPAIESECSVKFTDISQRGVDWWIDEPGFRPRIHQDGPKPSALQVYLQPDQLDLGTAFYRTSSGQDLAHYFASEPNTGYIMFNAHEPSTELWHDMQQAVPEQVLRLCLYVGMGPYTRL
jgi:hypothetical protein